AAAGGRADAGRGRDGVGRPRRPGRPGRAVLPPGRGRGAARRPAAVRTQGQAVYSPQRHREHRERQEPMKKYSSDRVFLLLIFSVLSVTLWFISSSSAGDWIHW